MPQSIMHGVGQDQQSRREGGLDLTIRTSGGRYCVETEDGTRFGCYRSKDSAKRRIRQIKGESRATKALLEAATSSDRDLAIMHDEVHQAHRDLIAKGGDHSAEGLLLRSHQTIVREMAERGLDHREGLAKEIADEGEGRGQGLVSRALDRVGLAPSEVSDDARPGFIEKAAEQRYTLGPVYVPGQVDAHGEWASDEDLQKALWGLVRKGNLDLRLQHTEKSVGEIVEVVTWPQRVTLDMQIPGEARKSSQVEFPANTPFMGVIWTHEGWELVKSGRISGYSIGGKAVRVSADPEGG